MARCSAGAVASQASPMEPQKYQKVAAVTGPSSVPKMCKDTPDLSAETADLPSNLSQDEEVAMQPRCTAVSILGDKVGTLSLNFMGITVWINSCSF